MLYHELLIFLEQTIKYRIVYTSLLQTGMKLFFRFLTLQLVFRTNILLRCVLLAGSIFFFNALLKSNRNSIMGF